MGNDDHRELAVERRLELLARSDAGGDGDCEGLHHRIGARARHAVKERTPRPHNAWALLLGRLLRRTLFAKSFDRGITLTNQKRTSKVEKVQDEL